MSSDVLVLAATAVLAVVAVVAAVVAVRASRRVAAAPRPAPATEATDVRRRPTPTPAPVRAAPAHREADSGDDVVPEPRTGTELEPRVVQGRVVVPPSGDQVVAAAMSRPHVRLSVLAHGIAHALRPESRDRITALVRREYRLRRRERQRAGRRAVRAVVPPTAASDRWMGELSPGQRDTGAAS